MQRLAIGFLLGLTLLASTTVASRVQAQSEKVLATFLLLVRDFGFFERAQRERRDRNLEEAIT